MERNIKPCECKQEYVDYTMWIWTKNVGGHFIAEWMDGESTEDVVKDFHDYLYDSITQNHLDEVLRAELRKHSNYVESNNMLVATQEDLIVDVYFNLPRGEEE